MNNLLRELSEKQMREAQKPPHLFLCMYEAKSPAYENVPPELVRYGPRVMHSI